LDVLRLRGDRGHSRGLHHGARRCAGQIRVADEAEKGESARVQSQVATIEKTLRERILSEYAGGTGVDLDPELDLLRSGTIDSMAVMELTSFIEEAFGVVVADEDIVPENFRSLRSLTEYVAAKKGIDVHSGFVADVRALVERAVPKGAVVVVLTHGDDALLQLDGPTGWHFPRERSGAFRSWLPSDGREAIEWLEDARLAGATHIAFPSTDLWWLAEYDPLREHLAARGAELARTDAGVVYALTRA
jgi:acyl carrier protein